MKNINEYDIHPRDVADKSSKDSFRKAMKLSLEAESDAIHLNTRTFNSNRYKAISAIDDYDELKDRARELKENSIKDLPDLIEQLTKVIESRGGKVYLAKTKEEANEYIKNVCLLHNAKLVVKAKSITSEEIGLNHVLEDAGVEVAETDLAEFILQVSKEQPSHIVAPAIHRSRERISELFKKNFKTDLPLETGEELTEFARDILRQKFLSADVGISGANLIAAEEGTILLVESEGNIRLTTQLPAVHVAIAGVEKIIPSKKDFGTFIELLAASGTGQSLTSYTNILEPPLELPILNLNGRSDEQREFHLVLLDNGRMKMREDKDLKEALYCIRCSACMNVCANFQVVGGHAFGGECYTGGIGGAWTVGTSDDLTKGRFAELCTGCSRCVPNCPVRIDIPGLNTVIKNRLIKSGEPSLQKQFFGNFSKMAKSASLIPNISNWVANLSFSRKLFEKTVGFDQRRPIPKFAESTLTHLYKKHVSKSIQSNEIDNSSSKIILFADVYSQYNNAEVGLAIIKVYEKLGLPVSLSKVMEDGRAAQSQGLIESAKGSAQKVAAYLAELIDEGNEIIFAEPSVLAMIKNDYKKLINDDEAFEKLKQHSFDAIEYLNQLFDEQTLDSKKIRDLIKQDGINIFYHGHCQMKSIGLGSVVPELLKKLGFAVEVSTVECCGMAGSFGYKKDYYDVSKKVGEYLGSEIRENNPQVILASGTSCREQISDEIKKNVLHPAEFLENILTSA